MITMTTKKPLVNPSWSRDEAFILGIIMGVMISVMMFLMGKAVMIYPWDQLSTTGRVVLGSLVLFGIFNTIYHWRTKR